MKRFLLLLCTFFSSFFLYAGNYTVNVGSTKTINCTATAPAGYITHAIYEFVDSEDANYLGLSYNTSDCFATVIGLQGKSSIKIRVTYSYMYTGTYDHKTHVGTGEYYDYITVVGGVNATDIKFTPSTISMKVGETVNAEVVLTPSNADSSITWGTAVGLPSKFNFEWSGRTVKITAKKEGEIVLVAQTDNGKTATCAISAKASDAPPTNVTMKEESVQLTVGKSKTFACNLTPSYAVTTLVWSSSDESVATVSSSGKVTAHKAGTAVIKVTTSNGLTAISNLQIIPAIDKIALEPNYNLFMGYNFQLTPTISPDNASPNLTWTSSNTSIATVDNSGEITVKAKGSAVITVKSDNDISTSTNIIIGEAPTILDGRNAYSRIEIVREMVKTTLENNRK